MGVDPSMPRWEWPLLSRVLDLPLPNAEQEALPNQRDASSPHILEPIFKF